jgi:polyhydroxybutyrate depolymerase
MHGHSLRVFVTSCLTLSLLVSPLTSNAPGIVANADADASTSSSGGCTTTTARDATLSIIVDGFKRLVIVHRPKGRFTTPLPLVLNLHGSGSTALEQEEFTGMNSTADKDHFIVAYPQALIPDGSGFDWNVPGVPLIGGRAVPTNAANDVAFLTSLVGILEARYCIDAQRVYATGFSGGARETSALGCVDSTIFAAIAPVSGLRRPKPCPTRRALPVVSFHGSADPVDPFAGHGQEYWSYSVSAAAKYWSTQDECTKETDSAHLENVKLTRYSNCADGSQVELYEIEGEGHEWPGGPRLPAALTSLLGPQSDSINADATIWSFFRDYRL